MQLARLLEYHRQSQSALSVSTNLGDAFLLEKNKIYKNIRKAAVAEGFVFSGDRDLQYEALPLSQLENLMRTKIIPVTDNVLPLESLPKEVLSTLSWDDVADHLKKNYLFHESCHAAARPLLLKLRNELKIASQLTSQQCLVATILLEESFANTCEMMAVAEAGDSVHRTFFEANSYFTMFENRSNIANMMKEIGSDNLFQFLLFSYLQSNFLLESLSEKTFELLTIEPLGDTGAKTRKSLRALSRICFQLDPNFRKVTTGFHLRMQGLTVDLGRLLDFDFVSALAPQKAYSEFSAAAAKLALSE